ncbi:MAG: hypothetical protein D3906_06940, partial [Candidatus Electrothrix sp. AUS1_2]|nr:hypothetical protein [Candidatus Electrothrix sp. AUS1_2]
LQIEQGGQTVVSFVLIDINWRASRKMLAYGTVFSRNRGRSCFAGLCGRGADRDVVRGRQDRGV